ncbi:E3 ubiquitin-protein ligase TRIM71-like [Mercenaria mercenaria]|uniref:E3 ubiquitin-protein ligase TRIM71-like n=1 Tax=Mercenaria mercenaria TaxID=6596 RepID=UPI001E1D2D2B|nr:E3 ubiquitin-protein ligase TRIM71-like [Mercenaria mercenaria]
MADDLSVKSNKSGNKKAVDKTRRKRKEGETSSVVSESRSPATLTSFSKQDDTNRMFQLCAPCLREDRNVESTNFCDNCQENLCLSCVHQHSKFPTMKDHVIHGHQGETVPIVPLKLEKCEKHNGKVLDMYCYDHDAVHCAACIAINHRKCKKVSYLPEAAKDIAESQEYKDVLESVTKIKVELETSRTRRQEDNIRLVKEKEDVIIRIKYVRKNINRCLDNLEKLTMDKLDAEYKKYNEKVNRDVASCEDIISKLEELTQKLSKDQQLDDANRFIQMRRATHTVSEGQKIVQIQGEANGTEQIQFIPDNRVNEVIKSFPSLGYFASKQKLLQGTLIGQFDVHVGADVTTCQVLGSDFLPDGKAVVTDWENKKLKLLDTSYKVIDYLKLPGCPYSVCSISHNEGVVSITNMKKLQFFSIDSRNKIIEGKGLKMSEFCRDVACSNSQIFVVCGALKEGDMNQISILSMDGKLIRNIESNNSSENMFIRPQYIALNRIGTIFIGDEDKGIIALDENGKVVDVFSNKLLKYPHGVTVVNNDQIFACGFGSHNLVQIGRNMVLLGEVLSEKAGFRHPRSVCYDVNSQRILVTCKNTNFVRVYSLK